VDNKRYMSVATAMVGIMKAMVDMVASTEVN
jgi:hypothetical protein